MAVTKRLRYEVLRRDGYACRYCGAKAPDVELTVDHVTPKALGGTDTPDNLVACCQPCNAGKTSMGPDAPIVADVSAEALEWASDVRDALHQIGKADRYVFDEAARFLAHWEAFEAAMEYGSDRPGWRASCEVGEDPHGSIERFIRYGLTFDMLDHAMQRALYIAPGVRRNDKFRYFCGVCWSKIKEAEDRVAGR